MSAIRDLFIGLSVDVLAFIASLTKRRRDDLLESLRRFGAEEVDDKVVLLTYTANWGVHPQHLPLFATYMP